MKCRCTPTKASTTAQIQALAVEKLEALADALLDFQGPAVGCLAGSQRLKQGLERLFRVLYGLYGIVHVTASVLFELLDA